MRRAILVVPERSAGWHPDGVRPLLNEAECGSHAALCAAEFAVTVLGEGAFLGGCAADPGDLVVQVRPGEDSVRSVESVMGAGGGCVLRILDRPDGGASAGPRLRRRVVLDPPGPPLEVARLPLRSRVTGWRGRVAFPSLSSLRPGPEDRIAGKWNEGGGPALLQRTQGRLRVWTAGFPLDHLEAGALLRLAELLGLDRRKSPGREAVPDQAAAAVLLLHDVEEALPGDPRGVASVREGTEACLELQARHGFRATYNLVGAFAEQIPDLVRRMVSEGHEVASHGATHRVMADLDPASLRDEVAGAEERIGRISGTRIRGFRSPRSRWGGPLLDLLAERGYLWNAEADPSPFPYRVPRGDGRGLVRVPVAVDDWDYVRKGASPRQVLDLWKREVVSAERRGCWVAIGSHPSVLGARPARMDAFAGFLEWLAGRKLRVMTLGEAASWWQERMSPEDNLRGRVLP